MMGRLGANPVAEEVAKRLKEKGYRAAYIPNLKWKIDRPVFIVIDESTPFFVLGSGVVIYKSHQYDIDSFLDIFPRRNRKRLVLNKKNYKIKMKFKRLLQKKYKRSGKKE